MGQGYQERDFEIINYHQYDLDGFDYPFRGPKPSNLGRNKYFMCLGAAQTFGCFTEKPFPFLLSQKLELEVLNAGVAGAGPSFFLNKKRYLQMAKQARFVIIQVMSGRSESNQFFDCPFGRGILIRRSDGKKMIAEHAYNELLKTTDQKEVCKIIEETILSWTHHMVELLNLIKVPKVLFWFSVRSPNYEPGFENAQNLFGKFPQFINQEMLEQIVTHADYFVKCISSAGLPQELISRFSGEKTFYANKHIQNQKRQYNYYYPSPEMHQLAFDELYPACQKILSST
ncbi:MAG: DUF6473 family protein [Bacteroidales bacterium]|nr:DUF6473 family protein [Bacteroidales bacterium]